MVGFKDQIVFRDEVCEQHGQYKSKMITNVLTGKLVAWTGCQRCRELEKAKEDKKAADDAKQEKLDRLNNKLARAGIPAGFRDRTFDNYVINNPKQANVVAQCKRYAERFDVALKNRVSLAMIGRQGCGKNHLALAIANHIMQNGYTAHFDDAYMMLSDIKHAQSSRDKSETEAIRALAIPDLLIIDEVGDQVGSEANQRLLNKVINERYAENKPVLLISNLPKSSKDGPSIDSFLGTKILSRLRHGGGKVLEFDWEDYRAEIKVSGIWD